MTRYCLHSLAAASREVHINRDIVYRGVSAVRSSYRYRYRFADIHTRFDTQARYLFLRLRSNYPPAAPGDKVFRRGEISSRSRLRRDRGLDETRFERFSRETATHRYPFTETEEGQLPPGSVGVLHPFSYIKKNRPRRQQPTA